MAAPQANTVERTAEQHSALLKAQDIMTPNPRTCSPFSTVLEAVMVFRDADCGLVPVVENGKAIGVVTDRDVALSLAEHPDLRNRPVSEIMSQNVVSVPAETPLAQLKEKFGDRGVRRLLVTDGNSQLRGVIAWADISPHLSDQSVGQVVSEVVEQS